MYYIHKDHLGSYLTITNSSGGLVDEYSYDAWGRMRNPADWSDYSVSNSQKFDRGYTGHEHFPMFGLIHMNGRMYDPLLGRVLSPDNYVQNPFSSQNYNRYSYCYNNPLIYTDPSGESIKSFFQGMGMLLNYMGRGAGFFMYTGYHMMTGDWDNWDWDVANQIMDISGTFVAYAGVTGMSISIGMALGQGVGAVVTPLVAWGAAAAGISSTSFISGFAIGAIEGAITGSITGGTMSYLNGGDFWQGAKTGAIYGAVGGGVLKGLAYGFDAKADGRSFWTGKYKTTIEPVSLKDYSLLACDGCGVGDLANNESYDAAANRNSWNEHNMFKVYNHKGELVRYIYGPDKGQIHLKEGYVNDFNQYYQNAPNEFFSSSKNYQNFLEFYALNKNAVSTYYYPKGWHYVPLKAADILFDNFIKPMFGPFLNIPGVGPVRQEMPLYGPGI